MCCCFDNTPVAVLITPRYHFSNTVAIMNIVAQFNPANNLFLLYD